jgi:hypothetical protein
MFVKWKRRQNRREMWETHSAYLVESIRTESGPRHKHLCYIGSIVFPEHDLGRKTISNRYVDAFYGDWPYRAGQFWRTAMANFAAAGITGADLERVVALLEKTVPRPPDGDE